MKASIVKFSNDIPSSGAVENHTLKTPAGGSESDLQFPHEVLPLGRMQCFCSCIREEKRKATMIATYHF
jgi:hypothetical protein